MVVESKKETKVSNTKTLGHFLSSALHLEEQFSTSVYRDYLDPQDWPLDLAPDVLSILIGVNDFWHTFGGGYTGSLDTYEQDYTAFLAEIEDGRLDAFELD